MVAKKNPPRSTYGWMIISYLVLNVPPFSFLLCFPFPCLITLCAVNHAVSFQGSFISGFLARFLIFMFAHFLPHFMSNKHKALFRGHFKYSRGKNLFEVQSKLLSGFSYPCVFRSTHICEIKANISIKLKKGLLRTTRDSPQSLFKHMTSFSYKYHQRILHKSVKKSWKKTSNNRMPSAWSWLEGVCEVPPLNALWWQKKTFHIQSATTMHQKWWQAWRTIACSASFFMILWPKFLDIFSSLINFES